MTFVQGTFVLGTFVHISNISISKLNTFDFSLVVLIFLLERGYPPHGFFNGDLHRGKHSINIKQVNLSYVITLHANTSHVRD